MSYNPDAPPVNGNDYFGLNSGPLAGMPPPAAPEQPAAPAATPAAPAPPQDPAAKAQAAAQQKVEQLQAMLEKYMDFDPSKVPGVSEQLEHFSEDTAAERTAAKDLLESVASWKKLEQPPPPPPDATRQAVPDMRDFAVKAAPWLMMLTGLGGKVAGLSGLNMLGAMNGMLKGTMAGQRQMFEDAYQKWNDNWKRVNDDYRNQVEFYNANVGWRKGQVDAEARAVEAVHTMAGEDIKNAQNLVGLWGAKDKVMTGLAAMNSRLELQRQNMAEKDKGLRLKYWQDYKKTAAAFPRNTAAKAAADRAYDLLPQVLNQYMGDPNDGPRSPVPKSLARWLSSTSTPEVQAFVSDLRDAKPILMALETSGTGARSNMLLQMVIGDTVPSDLFNKGPAEIDRLARSDKAILDSSWNTQKQQLDTIRSMAKADVGLDIPDEPAFEFPTSSLPAGSQSADDRARGGGSSPSSPVDLNDYLKMHGR